MCLTVTGTPLQNYHAMTDMSLLKQWILVMVSHDYWIQFDTEKVNFYLWCYKKGYLFSEWIFIGCDETIHELFLLISMVVSRYDLSTKEGTIFMTWLLQENARKCWKCNLWATFTLKPPQKNKRSSRVPRRSIYYTGLFVYVCRKKYTRHSLRKKC